MYPIDKVRERCERDPMFRSLVMMLEDVILGLKLSPSEVREAAMYACLRVEERRMPSHVVMHEPGRIERLRHDSGTCDRVKCPLCKLEGLADLASAMGVDKP